MTNPERLTREQVNELRGELRIAVYCASPNSKWLDRRRDNINALLCDMALASLSPPEGETVDEWAERMGKSLAERDGTDAQAASVDRFTPAEGAAAMREACAKTADYFADKWKRLRDTYGDDDDNLAAKVRHDEASTIAERIRALPLPAQKDGWVMVPREPTEEMVAAGGANIAASPGIDAPKLPAPCWHGAARSIYKSMIAAVTRETD